MWKYYFCSHKGSKTVLNSLSLIHSLVQKTLPEHLGTSPGEQMSAPWDLASEQCQVSRSPGSCDFPQPERLGLRKVTSRKWLHFESIQIATQFKKAILVLGEMCNLRFPRGHPHTFNF